jgi:hypothetical protein
MADERFEGGRVIENPEFIRFAHHWRFRPRACRPYRAKTKGKVERPIRYVRGGFFYGRHFVSDGDLNGQVTLWLDEVANVRLHRTILERPIDRFERDERAALRPLAQSPYRSLAPSRTKPSRPVPTHPAVAVERRSLEVYTQLAEGGR